MRIGWFILRKAVKKNCCLLEVVQFPLWKAVELRPKISFYLKTTLNWISTMKNLAKSIAVFCAFFCAGKLISSRFCEIDSS